mgnify:CR=1 FL=1
MPYLKLITGPSSEPITAAQVRLYSRINYDAEESLIAMWITAARREAENYLRRSLLTQTWMMGLDEWPQRPLDILRPPLQSVSFVNYYAYTNEMFSYPLANLIVDNSSASGRISLGFAKLWPFTILRPIDSIQIQYTAGYGATAAFIPANIIDAMLLFCAYRYENRTAEGGEMPRHFYDLLDPDRVYSGL